MEDENQMKEKRKKNKIPDLRTWYQSTRDTFVIIIHILESAAATYKADLRNKRLRFQHSLMLFYCVVFTVYNIKIYWFYQPSRQYRCPGQICTKMCILTYHRSYSKWHFNRDIQESQMHLELYFQCQNRWKFNESYRICESQKIILSIVELVMAS